MIMLGSYPAEGNTMRKLLSVYAPLFPFALLLLLTSSHASIATHTQHDDDTDECPIASPPLELFIQPLSFPPSIDLSLGMQITIGAYTISQKLHPDLPNTTLYAFGTSKETAAVPGPTLMARRGIEAHVRWENHIPDDHHFLPQAMYVEWANPSRGGVPVVVHLHGGESPSIYDGHPEAWMTSRNETGPTFVTQDYVYSNEQPATGLWYHDHTLGITRLNVLAGLVGMYIIRPTEEEEEEMGLPEGAPLVMKDMRFYANGSLMMTGPEDFASSGWCPEWYDVWLVNGRAWPFVHVYAKPYRFRILNACNARFIALHYNESIPFLQIGTDGGLLAYPWEVEPYILLSPGERADVIIDFSGLSPNSEVVLHNAPVEPEGGPKYAEYTGPTSKVILKFIIVTDDGLQEGLINSSTNNFRSNGCMEKLTTHMMHQHMMANAFHHELAKFRHQQDIFGEWNIDVVVREVVMNKHSYANGSIYEYTFGENLEWDDPVDIMPQVGSYEVWEVMNGWILAHNFHMHLVQFKVLNEQTVDVYSYVAKNCSLKIPYPQNGTCFTNYPQIPSFYNQGWKDTFSLFGSTMIRILVHFTPQDREAFSFDATLGPGYVLHCHIVQHEDHSTMRPFVLTNFANDSQAWQI